MGVRGEREQGEQEGKEREQGEQEGSEREQGEQEGGEREQEGVKGVIGSKRGEGSEMNVMVGFLDPHHQWQKKLR